jgi:hypothetical protein
LANATIRFGNAHGPEESKYELTDREYVRRMKAELIEIGKTGPTRTAAHS